jgi:hypothetical protein
VNEAILFLYYAGLYEDDGNYEYMLFLLLTGLAIERMAINW